MTPDRNAFGKLCVAPERLTQRGRVDVLRRLAGELQAANDAESQWLGATLTRWLSEGGDLAAVLGLRPPPGSHATAQAVVRNAERDRAIVRLSVAAGGDRSAVRILQGKVPCPPSLREFVAAVQAVGAPRSVAAFGRARARVSRAGE